MNRKIYLSTAELRDAEADFKRCIHWQWNCVPRRDRCLYLLLTITNIINTKQPSYSNPPSDAILFITSRFVYRFCKCYTQLAYIWTSQILCDRRFFTNGAYNARQYAGCSLNFWSRQKKHVIFRPLYLPSLSELTFETCQ